MPPTPSTLFMNFEDVVVTPSGGAAIAFAHVTDVAIDGQGTQQTFFGANRKWGYLTVNRENMRTLSIQAGDATKAIQIPFDVPCTVTGKICDALNGSEEDGGAVAFTLINAVRAKAGAQGSNNKFIAGAINFVAYGGPGDTDPLTLTPITGD